MTEPLRILILEDNPADVELIQFELEEAGIVFTPKVVMTEEDFVRELQEYCSDLILSDYDLPKYNGALALAEARRRCPDTPFILVTGAVTEDRAIEILTQGAKDYVLKNRLEQRLVPAVRRALAEAEEHRARKQAEEKLREAYRTLEERVNIRTVELEAEIEARKKTEAALRVSEERFRSYFELGLIGMAITSPAKGFLEVNEKLCAMLGYERSELVKLTWAELTHEDDLLIDIASFNRVLAGEIDGYSIDKRFVHKSGDIVEVTLSVKGVRTADGPVDYFVALVQDITGRKWMEKFLAERTRELEEANRELESYRERA